MSSTGTMTSPSYPGNYGNDVDCLFAVVPTSGPNSLKLKINDLHLTGDGDFLEVLFSKFLVFCCLILYCFCL